MTGKRHTIKRRRYRKQRGGFPTTQLQMIATENPLYSYATTVGKTTNGIDRIFANTNVYEISKGITDDIQTVDSWLASIVLYGKIKGMDEVKLPSFEKTIEIRNQIP